MAAFVRRAYVDLSLKLIERRPHPDRHAGSPVPKHRHRRLFEWKLASLAEQQQQPTPAPWGSLRLVLSQTGK